MSKVPTMFSFQDFSLSIIYPNEDITMSDP